MSQNLEDNRRRWPTPSVNWIVGQDEIDPSKAWEPPSSYPQGGEYAKVRAWTWRAGHSVEIDETKDGERIRIIHPKGSYTEINPDGSWTHRANNNSYEIVAKDRNVKVKGDCHVHIEGDANVKVDGDMRWEVGGDMTMTVGGKVEWKTAGTHHTDTPLFHVTGSAMGHNDKNNGDTHEHIEVMPGPGLTGVPTPLDAG